MGAIGQIGLARGCGEGKKLTFLLFLVIVLIFLEDFCQTQSEIGEILMMNFWGVGGPLDFCCWKKRQPGVVASPEDFSLWSKASVFSKATVDLQKERLQDSTSPPRYMYSK